MLLDNLSISTAGLALALTGLLYLLKLALFPAVDSREPPLLKPRLPILGHLVSMIREKAGFYKRLFKEHPMPICTLPILNGKLYLINSPSLIQAALRNTDIAFDPFIIEFSKGMFGLNQKQVGIIARKEVMKELFDVIHATLLGDPLHRLNMAALTKLMTYLNRIPPTTTVAVPNSFMWVRDVFTEATATALFGEKNPLTSEHVHHLWTFDEGFALLAMDIVPNLLARKSVAARSEINKILLPYYEAGHEKGSDVSDIIRGRAAALRKHGFSNEDLATQELLLPWVGSTNTIPTLFWLLVRLFSNPIYLGRVRAEIEAATSITGGPGARTAVVDASKLEKQCPVLNACYQESLRMYVHSIGNRRVMKDTKLQDPEGREYLLKKGVNVQWPAMVTHFLDSVWGDDAETYNPERFLNATAQDDKSRRGAMLPFGGGRNLCPGRRFAFTEILGFVGVLSLGFEVQGLDLPDSIDPMFGSAPRRPDWAGQDPGFTLSRRSGWEDVTWTFKE
ncbi:hypothetical protein FZEAL_8572 [Fusarium zealandicum]|uniref:7-alpha-hydroxycholest-4-en-3-one 12-alpha-hydroxylase n=1 Tax=Fusarium zealandicum TaxID=1053134 RepID=A0A8H4UE49_9HYPO|nr:hypothetical protein FZEAL_8572 [Fusarium zealandicum]